jgi:hypothetical protein
MDLDYNDPLDGLEVYDPKAVPELAHELVYYRPHQVALALDLPLAGLRGAVTTKRLKPDAYLVIDQERYEPLFEAGSLGRVRKVLARSED